MIQATVLYCNPRSNHRTRDLAPWVARKERHSRYCRLLGDRLDSGVQAKVPNASQPQASLPQWCLTQGSCDRSATATDSASPSPLLCRNLQPPTTPWQGHKSLRPAHQQFSVHFPFGSSHTYPRRFCRHGRRCPLSRRIGRSCGLALHATIAGFLHSLAGLLLSLS